VKSKSFWNPRNHWLFKKQETTTRFAFRVGPATFGIFDTFANEAGLQAHLNGAIAKALFAKAEELFAKPPQIQQVEIFAAKPLS
jgi:quinol monooxygenase YgiN